MTVLLWMLACCGTGSAIFLVCRASAKPRAEHSTEEQQRRTQLAQRSVIYRYAHGFIDASARVLACGLPKSCAEIERYLRVLHDLPWKSEEFLSAQLVAWLSTAVVVGGGALLLGMPFMAVGLSLLIVGMAPRLIVKRINRLAEQRVVSIRNQLPFTLNLMALILEAGNETLAGCLRLAARENRDHALGKELRMVMLRIDRGASVSKAMVPFVQRMEDSDIREVGTAIATAESSGMQLKDRLRTISERLRVRQTQWSEKAAEEARVAIVAPTMLIMAACLLIIATPALVGVLN